MKYVLSIASLLAACDPARVCGPGTHEVGDVCVRDENDAGSPLEDAGSPIDGGAPIELPDDVFVIDGIGADGTDSSYAALDRAIGDAVYVGIGESVHTVGGYYRAKQRIFRHLVEQHGFRAFAIESPWTDADIVSEYLETCEGDRDAAIRSGLFGVWASDEFAAIVDFMCAWNAAHADDRIVFFGFDIQQPWDDGPSLIEWLTRVAGKEAEGLSAPIRACHGATSESAADFYSRRPLLTTETHAQCIAGLDALDAWIEAHREDLAGEELAYIEIRSIGLRAWEGEMYHYEDGPDPQPLHTLEDRDRGMAAVLERMRALRAPDARVAVWAHNTHLSKRHDRMQDHFGGGYSMGTFLSESLGDDYVAIALIGYDVSISWRGVGFGPMPLPSFYAIESELHRLEQPYLFVDLGAPGDDRAIDPGESITAQGDRFVADEQFDGFFFLNVAEGMHPL